MSDQINSKVSLAKTVAKIAAAFGAIICIMLIANYLQLKSVDPLESESLKVLVERLHKNPHDEVLKQDIRALDLLIRKAYFTSQWQIKMGAYLLLLSIIVAVVATRYAKSLTSKIDELESIEKNTTLDKIIARKWLIYLGGTIFLLALVSGILSNSILDTYKVEEPLTEVTNESAKEEAKSAEVTLAAAENNSETNTIVEEEKVAEVIEEKEIESTKMADEDPAEENTVTEKKNVTEVAKEVTNVEETEIEEKVEEEIAAPKAVEISAEDWNKNYASFRGSQTDGIVHQKTAPTKWDGASGDNILWKIKTPKHGFSSPIIWGDNLFITGADEVARQVYCYNKNTGELVWQVNADNVTGSPAKMPKTTEDTGLAASTMASDGKNVFAIFGSGDVIALSFTGERIWAKNIGVPDNHYGHSSSLVTYKNMLLIQFDTNKGGKLLALNVNDGNEVWSVKREGVKISWATPVIIKDKTGDQVVLNAEPLVVSYNPNTGEKLWEVDCMMGEVGPSVGYENGIIYAANEYATLAAIDIATGEKVWESSDYLPEVSSPLAANGMLIIATSYGVVACFDAKNGEMFWELECDDGFYGSPIVVNDNVYAMDLSGKMYIFKLAKEYTEIAKCELGEKSASTPTFSNGKVYVRGFDNLYCIGK